MPLPSQVGQTWNRPCSSAGAAAGLARSVGHHLHPDGDALDRLYEVHRDLALDVATPAWPAGGGVAVWSG